jgi:hypothetical protein
LADKVNPKSDTKPSFMQRIYRHPLLKITTRGAATTSVHGPSVKTFEIYRYNPETPNVKPHLQV